MDSQIGFGAKMSVNDGTAGAHADLTGTSTLMLPKEEWGEYEEKKLSTATKNRKWKPTLRDLDTVTVEHYYSKADHARILALSGVEGKEFKAYAPDVDGAGAETAELLTILGWVKSVGEVKFEKDKETMFSFVIRVDSITYASATNNFPAAG